MPVPQDVSTYTVIITALSGTVVSMAGFIVWLFRDSLSRADERIKQLEQREDQTLATLAANVGSMLEILKVIAEIVRELRMVSQFERRGAPPAREVKSP